MTLLRRIRGLRPDHWIVLSAGLFQAILACSSSDQAGDASSQDLSTDDRNNPGASFNEVVAAVRKGAYDKAKLPTKDVTLTDVFSSLFLKVTGLVVDSTADVRQPFQRIIHPNGVCLVGKWTISEETPYSGLFKKGTSFPIIARLSPPGDPVPKAHQTFSLGIAGKIFPTNGPDERVKTAALITQTDIGGYDVTTARVLSPEIVMTNAPDVTALNRGFGLPIFARVGVVLGRIDVMTTERQLYQLAEANNGTAKTNTPRFMKLAVSPESFVPDLAEGNDFRTEVVQQFERKGSLSYDITLSNDGQKVGPEVLQRSIVNWEKGPVGHIVFDEAVLSSACDEEINFLHPAWRDDRNSPGSEVRTRTGAAFGEPLVKDQVAISGDVLSPHSQQEVFDKLDAIQQLPTWQPPIVSSVAPRPEPNFFDLTFQFDGETIASSCRHESHAPDAISLSCRGTTSEALFLTRPVDNELTFTIAAGADGQTQVHYDLVLRSSRAADKRDALASAIQTILETQLRAP